MSLILNEIYLLDGFKKTAMVAAADIRLTVPKAKTRKGKHLTAKKLFEIKHLRGTVSYFGVSRVLNRGRYELLSSWLPNYIKNQYSCSDLGTFAKNLKDTLNQIMPKDELKLYATGFYICGYNDQGIPEFWHFSNCNLGKHYNYINIQPRFKDPSADFLGRDALKLGWDGKNVSSVTTKGFMAIYRNGDFRVHEAAWKKLDEVFEIIFQFNDFREPKTLAEFKNLVHFKLNFIGSIYQKWAKSKTVGGPFDVIVRRSTLYPKKALVETIY
jgi:hypothetical protein